MIDKLSIKYRVQVLRRVYLMSGPERLDRIKELGARRRRRRAYQREYYERNKDQLAAYQREYYERNKDQRAAYQREYYERNKDQLAAHAPVPAVYDGRPHSRAERMAHIREAS